MVAKPESKNRKAKNKGEALAEVVELLEQIEQAEEAVAESEVELDARREEAKTAKGVWLTRVSKLRELVRTRKRWAEEAKRQPLLAGKPKANGQAAAVNGSADGWKSLTVTGLQLHDAKLSDKAIEGLKSSGVETCGELQEKIQRHGDFWAKELGVNGRYKVALEDALNAVVAVYTQETEDAAPASPAPVEAA